MSLAVNLFYGVGGRNYEDPPASDDAIDTYSDISDVSDYEQQIFSSSDDNKEFDDDDNDESDSANGDSFHIKLGNDKVTMGYMECPKTERMS